MATRKKRTLAESIDALLKKHGIEGTVHSIHLVPPTPDAASFESDCPPGQIKRTVCRRLPNGTFQCKEECEPI